MPFRPRPDRTRDLPDPQSPLTLPTALLRTWQVEIAPTRTPVGTQRRLARVLRVVTALGGQMVRQHALPLAAGITVVVQLPPGTETILRMVPEVHAVQCCEESAPL